MLNSFIKRIMIIFGLVLVLVIITLVNQNVLKRNVFIDENLYDNSISSMIDKNEVSGLTYKVLLADLNEVDTILKEQISLDNDKKKKTAYYKIAENVYDHKINEIVRILNDKLDDEDYLILQNDLDEFYKNIEYANNDLYGKLESSLDVELYSNKYAYEEKQRKCREILESYKGFLK